MPDTLDKKNCILLSTVYFSFCSFRSPDIFRALRARATPGLPGGNSISTKDIVEIGLLGHFFAIGIKSKQNQFG